MAWKLLRPPLARHISGFGHRCAMHRMHRAPLTRWGLRDAPPTLPQRACSVAVPCAFNQGLGGHRSADKQPAAWCATHN